MQKCKLVQIPLTCLMDLKRLPKLARNISYSLWQKIPGFLCFAYICLEALIILLVKLWPPFLGGGGVAQKNYAWSVSLAKTVFLLLINIIFMHSLVKEEWFLMSQESCAVS